MYSTPLKLTGNVKSAFGIGQYCNVQAFRPGQAQARCEGHRSLLAAVQIILVAGATV